MRYIKVLVLLMVLLTGSPLLAGEKEELLCKQENLQLRQTIIELQSQILQLQYNINKQEISQIEMKLQKLQGKETK